jgi:ribosome-associated protein
MESETLAQLCRNLADDKKAEDIVVLDVREISSITDFFVIASGGSDPHLRAIVNEIDGGLLKHHKMKCTRIDGDHLSGWIAMDYVDVIVHVMRADSRETYDLEGLWSDAKKIPPVPVPAKG